MANEFFESETAPQLREPKYLRRGEEVKIGVKDLKTAPRVVKSLDDTLFLLAGKGDHPHVFGLAGLDVNLSEAPSKTFRRKQQLLISEVSKTQIAVKNQPEKKDIPMPYVTVEPIGPLITQMEVKEQKAYFTLPAGEKVRVRINGKEFLVQRRKKKGKAIVTHGVKVVSEDITRKKGDLRVGKMSEVEKCDIFVVGDKGKEMIVVRDHGGGTIIEPVTPYIKRTPEPVRAVPESAAPELPLKVKEYSGYGLTGAGATTVGRRHKEEGSPNEDNYAFPPEGLSRETIKRKGSLYLVADGMGGHAAGEVASGIALKVIPEFYYNQCQGRSIQDCLTLAIEAAHNQIYEEAQKDERLTGMGTTVTAAVIHGNNLYIGHVGDSRAFLANESGIQQLTRGHTKIQEELINKGIEPTSEQRAAWGHYLTRCLGIRQYVDVDITQAQINSGNEVILCTDGLSNYVGGGEIAQKTKTSSDLPKAVKNSINTAYQRGSVDDITLLVVRKNQ